MCESLSPGITVLPPTSTILVASLRKRMTSLSEPTATKRPSLIATDEANEPRPSCVATRPFEMIISAWLVSWVPPVVDSPHPAKAYDRPKAPADLKKSLRVGLLLMGTSRLQAVTGDHAPLLFLHDHVLRSLIALDERLVIRRHHGIQLGELGGFRSVPCAVNFAQDRVGRSGDDAGLYEARQCCSRCHFARVARSIHNRVHLEACCLRIKRRKHDADAGPYAGHDQSFFTGFAHRFDEKLVVPCVDFSLTRHKDC